MPAGVQITAEQLLREAKERELELVAPPPKQKISDPDELKSYQLRKRKVDFAYKLSSQVILHIFLFFIKRLL